MPHAEREEYMRHAEIILLPTRSGSGGTRTHSIPGSKPRWSAVAYRAGAQGGIRTRNRPGLGRAAVPTFAYLGRKVVLGGLEPPIVTL